MCLETYCQSKEHFEYLNLGSMNNLKQKNESLLLHILRTMKMQAFNS